MPYLHCPDCRLTIYKPRALAGSAERCPRCDARLSHRPRRLFGEPDSVPVSSVRAERPPPPRAAK